MSNIRKLLRLQPKLTAALARRTFSSDLYEPDYLEAMKSKVPLYDTLNIQLRGHDFAVLENFQKFVHSIAKNADVDVEDCWGVPAQDIQVSTYKPNSEIVTNQYLLRNYERTVQITDVSAQQLQILLRAIEASTPEGVTVKVVAHEEYHDEVRYIPDQELKTLKQELEDIAAARRK